MFSLSFRRLWPLRYQLQWLSGGSETWVRFDYISCNSLIVHVLFLERNLLKRIILLQWQFDVSELFVTEYCCSDSVIVKLFCCNCCSDSFVGKLTNFNSSILLVFRYEGKKLLFFQFIGMLTLWSDDRWLVHMDTQVSDGVAIDGLVNGVSLVFTMLRTYTSSKSGLSARKSESNSGDATISLRMVNKDTSRTCITLLCTFTH